MSGLVFLAAFAFYLRALSPGLATDDVPEMILAGWRLDVTHPPGYPLYVLLAKLFSCLPAGSLAFRVNLLSAAAGAASVMFVFGAARVLARRFVRAAPLALVFPALAAFILMSAHTWWWQCTQADKYALHFALAAACVRLALAGASSPLPLAFTLGLAMAHHPLSIFLAPLVVLHRNALRRPRPVLLAILFFTLPFGLKPLYPAIRAAAGPPVNWGRPADVRSAYSYLAVRQYASKMDRNIGVLAGRTAGHALFYPHQFGAVLTPLAAAGLVALCFMRPGLALPIGIMFAGVFVFALQFNLDHFLIETYHAPNVLLLAIGLAGGASWLANRLSPASRIPAVLAAAVFVLAVARLPGRWHVYDRSRNTLLHDLNRNTLAFAPPGSFLLAGSDYDLFALRYITQAEGRRPDVTILDLPGQSKRSRGEYWARTLSSLSLSGLPLRLDSNTMGLLTSLINAVPRSRCLAFSTLADPSLAVPLMARGPLLLPRRAACAPRSSPGLSPWRALTLRQAFAPSAAQPWNVTVLAVYGHALDLTVEALVAEGRDAEALRASAFRLRLLPMAADSWSARGAVLAHLDLPLESLEAYSRASGLDPESLEPYVARLEIVRSRRARHELAPLVAEAAENLPLSSGSTTEALEALEEGRLDRAAAKFGRALAEEALKRAEGVETLDTLSPGDPRRPKLALGLALEAIRADPKWDKPYAHATGAMMRMFALDEALKLAGQWRSLAPADAEAELAYGTILLALGRPEEAVRVLVRAVELDPASADARRMLAQAREVSRRIGPKRR